MSTESEYKRIRMLPEQVDELTYLHPDIATYIKNTLAIATEEAISSGQVPFLFAHAAGNIAQAILEEDQEGQFRKAEFAVGRLYEYCGADSLITFLVDELKLPLSVAARNNIHKYYEERFKEVVFDYLSEGQKLGVSDRFLAMEIIEDYSVKFEQIHEHKPRGYYNAPELDGIATILENYGFNISFFTKNVRNEIIYLIRKLKEDDKLKQAQALKTALKRQELHFS